MNVKKKSTIILCVIIGIIAVGLLINAVTCPISLKINPAEVKSAKIIYYGDGVEQKIENKNDLDLLIHKLNKLRFKENKDMSHLAPRSGVLVIDLYDENVRCIDSIQFYDWVYRGGEYKGEERGSGIYLKVKTSDDIYDLCDRLCGDPFDRLKYKEQYGY